MAQVNLSERELELIQAGLKALADDAFRLASKLAETDEEMRAAGQSGPGFSPWPRPPASQWPAPPYDPNKPNRWP